MRNAAKLKENKLAAVLDTTDIFQPYISAAKCHVQFLMRIPISKIESTILFKLLKNRKFLVLRGLVIIVSTFPHGTTVF